jgi:hypothetical protein
MDATDTETNAELLLDLNIETHRAFTNTPHFANPGANVSNMALNPDGTIRALGGFSEITATNATHLGRGASDERIFRFGLRVSF